MDPKELVGCEAIARFEARRNDERQVIRSRRWRAAVTLCRIAAIWAAGLFLVHRHIAADGVLWGLVMLYLTLAEWKSFTTQEELRTLRRELENLRNP